MPSLGHYPYGSLNPLFLVLTVVCMVYWYIDFDITKVFIALLGK
jgi:hypothetical protein